jgi:single-strand DNA-binding protein
MATLNKVMLIGRLTDNPEAPRSLPSGGTVVKFRFAVGRSKKNPQTGQWENDPNPLYIDCEAFARPDSRRDLVSLISQYAKKGDPMYLEGRLQLDQWEDKNGGGKRSKHKIVVESVEFLGSRGGEGGGGGGIGDEGGRGGGAPRGGGRPTGGGRTTPPPDDSDEYGSGGGTTNEGGEIPF